MAREFMRWTTREEARLREVYPSHGAKRSAQLLGRSARGVAQKASDLGLRYRGHRPWTTVELDVLRREYAQQSSVALAALLQRPARALRARALLLGVRRGQGP